MAVLVGAENPTDHLLDVRAEKGVGDGGSRVRVGEVLDDGVVGVDAAPHDALGQELDVNLKVPELPLDYCCVHLLGFLFCHLKISDDYFWTHY